MDLVLLLHDIDKLVKQVRGKYEVPDLARYDDMYRMFEWVFINTRGPSKKMIFYYYKISTPVSERVKDPTLMVRNIGSPNFRDLALRLNSIRNSAAHGNLKLFHFIDLIEDIRTFSEKGFPNRISNYLALILYFISTLFKWLMENDFRSGVELEYSTSDDEFDVSSEDLESEEKERESRESEIEESRQRVKDNFERKNFAAATREKPDLSFKNSPTPTPKSKMSDVKPFTPKESTQINVKTSIPREPHSLKWFKENGYKEVAKGSIFRIESGPYTGKKFKLSSWSGTTAQVMFEENPGTRVSIPTKAEVTLLRFRD